MDTIWHRVRAHCAANWVFTMALGCAVILMGCLVGEILGMLPLAAGHEYERALLRTAVALGFLVLVLTHALAFTWGRRGALRSLKLDLARAQQDGYVSGLQQARSERQPELDAMLRAGLTIGAEMTPKCRQTMAGKKWPAFNKGEPLFPPGEHPVNVNVQGPAEGGAAAV